jgi:hypothetical protein
LVPARPIVRPHRKFSRSNICEGMSTPCAFIRLHMQGTCHHHAEIRLMDIRKSALETLSNPNRGYARPDRQFQRRPNAPQCIQNGKRHCGVPVAMTGHIYN